MALQTAYRLFALRMLNCAKVKMAFQKPTDRFKRQVDAVKCFNCLRLYCKLVKFIIKHSRNHWRHK